MEATNLEVPAKGGLAKAVAHPGTHPKESPAEVDQARSSEAAHENDPNSTNQDQDSRTTEQAYKLSPRRWLILFAISLCGLVGAATSQFSSILRLMLELLEMPRNKYVYLSQMFNYLPAISSMPSAWFIDKYGLKRTVQAALALSFVRHATRALLFWPHLAGWQNFKLLYWIVSGVLTAQIGSIFMCLPLKVSENWFAKSERSFAWTVMISSIDVGNTMASFVYPRLVPTKEHVEFLAYFNLAGPLLVSTIVLVSVTRSNPKHPPSERMQMKSNNKPHPGQDQPGLWLETLKELLGRRQIMLHLIHGTVMASMAMSAGPLMQDIIVSAGHSEIFAGNLLALSSFVSVLMLISLSTLVHLVRNVTLTCKLASLLESLIYAVHLVTLLHPIDERIIMAVAVLFVSAKCWRQPNNTEMTGHLIHGSAISEATISAVSSTLFILVASVAQIMFVKLIRRRPDGSSDYGDSIRATSIVCLVNSLIYFIFFEGPPTQLPSSSSSELKANLADKPSSIVMTVWRANRDLE